MVKVVITGGSGYLAQHLIKKLQDNHLINGVEEIVTVDRKPPSQKVLKYSEHIPVYHKQCELTNLTCLQSILKHKDVVFHLARKRLEMLFEPEKDKEIHEAYIRDNIDATETLIEAMLAENVPYLIYLSDAYANLPIEDNYGLSEDNHPGIPKTFLIGNYGETRIRGELFARKSVGKPLKNGTQTLHGVFPRPVLTYGEGDSKLIETLLSVCQRHQGCIPYFGGSSRGMFQYIHAGNLAGILESCMLTLTEEPSKCNGDYFYCMEDTKATKINEFFAPLLEASGHSFVASGSYYLTYLRALLSEATSRYLRFSTPNTPGKDFSLSALRFLFGFGYGFSNRKQELCLNYRTEVSQSEALKKTVQWVTATFGRSKSVEPVIPVLAPKGSIEVESKPYDNVLRMG